VVGNSDVLLARTVQQVFRLLSTTAAPGRRCSPPATSSCWTVRASSTSELPTTSSIVWYETGALSTFCTAAAAVHVADDVQVGVVGNVQVVADHLGLLANPPGLGYAVQVWPRSRLT